MRPAGDADAAPRGEVATARALPPRRRARAGPAAAVALFAVVAVVLLWPVLSRPGARLYIGAPLGPSPVTRFLANDSTAVPRTDASSWGVLAVSDTLRGVHALAWWSHVLLDGARGASLYDTNMLYPTPRALAYMDLQLGVVPWFAPVWGVSRNPVLAYQVAQLVGLVGAAIGFFALVRSWTGSVAAGAVAGVASIVAPYRQGTMGVLYLHFLLYVPFALLCVDAIVAGRRRIVAWSVLVLCIVLQAASSGYLTFFTCLLLSAYVLGTLLESRSPHRLRALLPLAAAATVAALVLLWLYRPFIDNSAAGLYGRPADAAAPAHDAWLALRWDHPGLILYQQLAGVAGVPLLVLAALGLLHASARRRWTLLGVAGFGLVLALGPSLRLGPLTVPLPWDWLARLAPGFTVQRHPYVAAHLGGTALVCLAGLGAAWLAERARRRRWAIAVALLAVAALPLYRWQLPSTGVVGVASGSRVPPAYAWLAANGDGQPMLELPTGQPIDTVYAYYSTFHWLPIFNGSFSHPPPGYQAASAQAAKVLGPEHAAAAFLREVPVRWVLVHGALLRQGERARVASAPPALTEVARFGDDVLYRVRYLARRP